MEFGDSHWLLSPKATNSVAGGNATGSEHHLFSDPVRVGFTAIFDPFRVGSSFAQDPVALPPAIEFVAFGDITWNTNSNPRVFYSDL
jgi:hypothetical protein